LSVAKMVVLFASAIAIGFVSYGRKLKSNSC
jgi:hypothetical protein